MAAPDSVHWRGALWGGEGVRCIARYHRLDDVPRTIEEGYQLGYTLRLVMPPFVPDGACLVVMEDASGCEESPDAP